MRLAWNLPFCPWPPGVLGPQAWGTPGCELFADILHQLTFALSCFCHVTFYSLVSLNILDILGPLSNVVLPEDTGPLVLLGFAYSKGSWWAWACRVFPVACQPGEEPPQKVRGCRCWGQEGFSARNLASPSSVILGPSASQASMASASRSLTVGGRAGGLPAAFEAGGDVHCPHPRAQLSSAPSTQSPQDPVVKA